MARILAVDWDARELRLLLLSGGEKVALQTAVATPLIFTGEADQPLRPDLAESLRTALADVKVGRATVLVGVDRVGVEMLHLTLPPAKEAELPEMVLHQAMRESQAVSEESALDYFAVGGSATEPHQVTAASLSPERMQEILAVCTAAGVKPARLVLRPLAAASLLSRCVPEPPRTCLLVNLIGDEADLTLVAEGRARFLRTVRGPDAAEAEKRDAWLVGEIRRTLAVALQGELEQETAPPIYVFGAPGEHEAIVERIASELDLPVVACNPFDAVHPPEALVPAHAGRFAALLGMAIDEAQGRAPTIDFLRPRRRPKPHGRRRNLVVAAVVLGVLLLGPGLYVWNLFAAGEEDVARLDKDLHDLRSLLKKAGETKKVVEAIHDWQSGDIDWLDELRDISLRFPTARDMIVLRMVMGAGRFGGGEVDLQGMVRDPTIVRRMENTIDDAFHNVETKRVQNRLREKIYTWHFDASTSVTRRDKTQYTSHLPDQGAATAAEAPKPAEPDVAPVHKTHHRRHAVQAEQP